MSNFYTDYELPIITVRTRFYPRKPLNPERNKDSSLPSYKTLELTSKLIIKGLRDERLHPFGHR